jgi:hypothetical protein
MKASFEPSPKVVLLPFTATDISEVFLNYLLLERNHCEGIKLFRKLFISPALSLPFIGITRTDLIAYSYRSGFLEGHKDCNLRISPDSKIIAHIISGFEIMHTELNFSTLKSLKKLLKIKINVCSNLL